MGLNKLQLADLWQQACEKQNAADDDYEVGLKVLEEFQSQLLEKGAEFNDVFTFHKKFDQLHSVVPTHLTPRKLIERIKFMQEELNEFVEASGLELTPEGEYYEAGFQDLALQADALVDLAYVTLGTAVMMGLPWSKLWNDVQRANMAKERGISHRGNLVDCVKPEGWVPPKTVEILRLAGYNPQNIEFKDDQEYLNPGVADQVAGD